MHHEVDFGKWTLEQLRESLAWLLAIDRSDKRYARALAVIDLVTRELIKRPEVRRFVEALRR